MTATSASATAVERSNISWKSEGLQELLRISISFGASCLRSIARGLRSREPSGGVKVDPFLDFVEDLATAVIENPDPLVHTVVGFVTGKVWTSPRTNTTVTSPPTFEATFGLSLVEGWFYKFAGSGPPPPGLGLRSHANPFFLAEATG